MMSNDIITMLLALPIGVAAGLVYYGGLWMTLRALHTTRYPAALVALSLLGRLTLVAVIFYYVLLGLWLAALPLLAGFLIVRALMVRFLRPMEPDTAGVSGPAL